MSHCSLACPSSHVHIFLICLDVFDSSATIQEEKRLSSYIHIFLIYLPVCLCFFWPIQKKKEKKKGKKKKKTSTWTWWLVTCCSSPWSSLICTFLWFGLRSFSCPHSKKKKKTTTTKTFLICALFWDLPICLYFFCPLSKKKKERERKKGRNLVPSGWWLAAAQREVLRCAHFFLFAYVSVSSAPSPPQKKEGKKKRD